MHEHAVPVLFFLLVVVVAVGVLILSVLVFAALTRFGSVNAASRRLERVRPALAINRNKVRNLELDRLEELDATRTAHHNRIVEQLIVRSSACQRRLAVTHFEVEIDGAALGDRTVGHVQTDARVGRLEYAAVGVENAVGARYDRAVAVRVERQLAIVAVVVVVRRVGDLVGC